jgi:hypothetical protein
MKHGLEHKIILKYYIKLPSSYVYTVLTKHKCSSYLDLGSIPKITHDVYVKFQNKKKSDMQNTSGLKHLG